MGSINLRASAAGKNCCDYALAHVAKHTKIKSEKFIHCRNVMHYLSPGDDTEVEEFSMMRQLIYSMEMAEAGRREGCSHPLASPPAGIEQKKRTLALSHSVTLPLSQTERQHS